MGVQGSRECGRKLEDFAFGMGKKKKLGESTGFRRNRKKVGIRREIEFGETFFFFQLPFQDFLGSTLLLPSSPPPLLPSPARGNGRLLGRRSKRRNCLLGGFL